MLRRLFIRLACWMSPPSRLPKCDNCGAHRCCSVWTTDGRKICTPCARNMGLPLDWKPQLEWIP